MKKICPLIMISLAIIACQKDEPDQGTPKGTLALNVGLFISVSEEENNLKSASAGEDFLVTIYNSQGTQVQVFDRADGMPAEILLNPGQYYVTAHSNNDLPAAFSNPYYFGQSAVFTINPGETQSVTVNCELANVMVTMVYSAQVISYFTDYTATVTTSGGSLTFVKNETRPGYFRPMAMTISVTLTKLNADGTNETKTLTGSIPDPKPRRHYEIHINTTPDGSSVFQINVTEGIDLVEIVTINDSQNPPAGGISPGDLLITEIMYDPVSLVDTEGEWFEIYNNSNSSIDLDQLVIWKNETEHHIIDGPFVVEAHQFAVMARTVTAFAGTSYVYGTSISLNNTGAVLSIRNYGTDGTNGSVIFSLDYAAAEFPNGTGASICLSPLLMNYNQATSGSSWCVSTSSYSTGDLGTPALANDSCL